jgi:2-isopropylmalate synthase
MATVRLQVNGKEKEASASGNGPVNATLKAIHKIIKEKLQLEEFNIQAMHGGSDDVSKVNMRVVHDGKSFYGFGYSTDIVNASVNAYIDALNKIL